MRKVFIFVFILLINKMLFGQEISINGKKIEQGQTVQVFYDDLVTGKLEIALKIVAEKVEVSLDKGRSWQEMEKGDGYFVYGWRLLNDEELRPEFIITDSSAGIRTYKPNVRIVYQKKRPEEAVIQVLEKIKLFYEQENVDRFLEFFSPAYPEWLKFKEAVQNDFSNYKNIRLRYRIDRKSFTTDYQGAIWDVYWDKKYDDKEGNSYTDSATINMRFEKQGPSWLITGMRSNTIFGSTLFGAKADLEIEESDISGDAYKPIVTVRNVGSTAATNFTVKFYTSSDGINYTFSSPSHTISSLAGGAQQTVSHNITVGSHYTLKVVLDEENSVSETNEANNTVIKEFGL
ncbi:MAG: hypothetical protein N2606_00080 [Candidatus Omnitrophica bacterium]|nr:hypothetical protein [Candidatus Omnitrophota bacterium]